MGTIGHGHGSEWHLLRYFGRHRNLLDDEVLLATGGDAIGWIDFCFSKKAPWWDAELTGLDFLPVDDPVRKEWSEFWPQSGSVQNWDAVGLLRKSGVDEWLLIEAKDHLREVQSDCHADARKAGRDKIEHALGVIKADLGVLASADWMHRYYQHANRVAALWFLNSRGVPARLLNIYFVGDQFEGRVCPASPVEWEDTLEGMAEHLAMPANHKLSDRMHTLFLDVRG